MRSRITVGLIAAAVAALALVPDAGAAGYVPHRDLSYDRGSPPPDPSQTRLDLYEPVGFEGKRPVAVYVHGGGWAIGDKSNRIEDKARLFTDAGYVFVSVNCRLSPSPAELSNPDRVKFPDHPDDVAEALGWLTRNVAAYGGDRERLLLLGHSAGGHLVSLIRTDRSYLKANGVEPSWVRGVVSLDTAAFDVATRASQDGPADDPTDRQEIYWNAFGTPAENAVSGAWRAASPLLHADPKDPPFLLVTQAGNPIRVAENERMATALGQDPGGVVKVDATHEQINLNLGSPSDPTPETAAVTEFANAAVHPPRARIKGHTRRRLPARGKRTRARFRFKSNLAGATFECRIDKRRWKRCGSPQSYRVLRGKHTFRVRASNGVSAGSPDKHRFRVGAA